MISRPERLVLIVVVALGLAVSSCFFLIGIARSGGPGPERSVSSGPAIPASASDARPEFRAEILSVRTVPYVNHRGIRFAAVLCSWHNSGRRPVGAVFADLEVYTRDGRFLSMPSITDYCIYAGKPVPPGAVYTEASPEEGFLVPLIADDGSPLAFEDIAPRMRITRSLAK
jgi:hypothetical protein